jgi:hypothetical protein
MQSTLAASFCVALSFASLSVKKYASQISQLESKRAAEIIEAKTSTTHPAFARKSTKVSKITTQKGKLG